MAKRKLLIVALIVGAFAAAFVWMSHKQSEKKMDEMMADTEEVVIAVTDVSAGSPLEEDMVETEEIPVQFLPPNPVSEEEFEVVLGQPVATDIKEDDMILASHFEVAETSSNLSGRVPPGERAMSLSVDEVSGVSGLLRPGDRVDILGTFPVSEEDEVVPEAGGSDSTGYVTMTLLQNVTLLGVGQEISGGDVDGGQSSAAGRGTYSTVTGSVTLDEAELLTIAQTRGDLTLLLRHNEDIDMAEPDKKTLRQVLEDLEVLNDQREKRIDDKPKPKPKKDDDIEIIRGN